MDCYPLDKNALYVAQTFIAYEVWLLQLIIVCKFLAMWDSNSKLINCDFDPWNTFKIVLRTHFPKFGLVYESNWARQ